MSYPWSKGNTLVATELNAAIVGRVNKAGDTMTGPLVLPGAPTSNLQAATKQYVDSAVGGVVVPQAPSIVLLNKQFGPVGNGTDTTEDVLFQYTLPGGTLNTNGQILRVTCFGNTNATSLNRVIKLYFGTDQIGILNITGTQMTWHCEGYIVRTGPTSQLDWSGIQEGPDGTITGGTVRVRTVGAQNLSNDQIIKVTGQTTGSSAGNNIVADAFMVEMML